MILILLWLLGVPLGLIIILWLLGVSRYSAPLAKLGKIRSAGVTDLRFGSVIDEDWSGRDRFEHGGDPRRPVPLPEGVACYAVAASTAAAARRGTCSHGPLRATRWRPCCLRGGCRCRSSATARH